MGRLSEFLIRECRERGLSFRAAAQGAGLDYNAVFRYVNGTRPSRRSCAKLARFFGISEEQMLVLAGHMTPPETFTPETELEQRILYLFRLLPRRFQELAISQLDLWLDHRESLGMEPGNDAEDQETLLTEHTGQ